MVTKWKNYGQGRHPKLWWECYLLSYLRSINSQLIYLNPTVTEVKQHEILFIVDSSEDVYALQKNILVNQLNPEEN